MGMEIPPRGSRGATTQGRLNRLCTPVMKLQMARYRRSKGPEQPRMMGFPALLLTTVEAKSGQQRTVCQGTGGTDHWRPPNVTTGDHGN
jgi:hypothetical protein